MIIYHPENSYFFFLLVFNFSIFCLLNFRMYRNEKRTWIMEVVGVEIQIN